MVVQTRSRGTLPLLTSVLLCLLKVLGLKLAYRSIYAGSFGLLQHCEHLLMDVVVRGHDSWGPPVEGRAREIRHSAPGFFHHQTPSRHIPRADLGVPIPIQPARRHVAQAVGC